MITQRRRAMMQGSKGVIVHQMIDFDGRRQVPSAAGANELYPYGSAFLPTVDAITQGHIYYLTLMLQVESGTMTQNMTPYFSGAGSAFSWASLRSPSYTIRQAANLSIEKKRVINAFALYHSPAFAEGTIVTVRPMMFDLTADFGAGNEPSMADFEAMIGSNYYEYGEHRL